MAGFLAHSIRLSLVLGHPSVHRPDQGVSCKSPLKDKPRSALLNNVGTDWRLEDGGKRVSRAAGRAISRSYRNRRSGCHLVDFMVGKCCVPAVVVVNMKC